MRVAILVGAATGLHCQLRAAQFLRGALNLLWRIAEEEILDRHVDAGRADELTHGEHGAVDSDVAPARRLLSGDEFQQGGLAGSVGADECGVPAARDPQRDALEQQASPKQRIGEVGNLDDCHSGYSTTSGAPGLSVGRQGPPGSADRSGGRSPVSEQRVHRG